MARLVLLLVLLVGAALASESSNKPSEVETRCDRARSSKLTLLSNGKKYSFHTTFKRWNDANETCANQGLHLATIKSQNEAELVAAAAERIEDTGFWVSVKNQASGNRKDFRWQDGTKLELDSPLWSGGADKKKDCVYIFNWTRGKLNGYSCTERAYFICELPSECYFSNKNREKEMVKLRFWLLLFCILATVLADDDDSQQQTDQSTEATETEKPLEAKANEGMEINLNITDKNLLALIKIIEKRHYQVAEQFVSQATQTGQKFFEVERNFDQRYNQVAREMIDRATVTNRKLSDLENLIDKRLNQILENDEKKAKENQESVKKFNERFDKLEKLNEQTLTQVKQLEEERGNDRNKLDQISKSTEHHSKLFDLTFPEASCKFSAQANLKTLSNGKKYVFHEDNNNWNSAKEICANQGLQLATVKDKKDAQVVAAAGRNIYGGGWWVAATNATSGADKTFRWPDGTKLELDDPLWFKSAAKKYDCVYVYNWDDGKYDTYPCTYYFKFVCELPSECY
ncbi:uncharacterized protein LOC132194019 [Neocloeon triangulifer]|uniref:uncharacterized protein LOC132194019 n=1 Tax=Neocloeon triangulifer TaxID=2078957 RepID=UPI00286EC1BF|nr:uncharacterized protein LOC132194019 [Neocloeon triangulifer]